MRYIYPKPATIVPAPPELAPPPEDHIESLQELAHRRAETKKTRAGYHLTESDCDLICSNAKEVKFSHGQVVASEGAPIQSVYRIKSGKISLVKGREKLFDLTQGYFIGEGLFIRGEAQHFFGCALVANGLVVVHEINLPFVRQLISVDKLLAFKMYRYIASKLSVLVFAVLDLGNHCPCTPYLSRGRSDSTWSNSSDGSEYDNSLEASSELTSSIDSSTDSHSPQHSPMSRCESLSLSLSLTIPSFSHSSSLPVLPNSGGMSLYAHYNSEPDLTPAIMRERARKSKFTSSPRDKAFKKYLLYEKHAGGYVELFSSKLVIAHNTKLLSPKKTIKYNKILDLAKAAQNSITIIYGVQAKTLFLKDSHEVDEFYGLVHSLVTNSSDVTAPRSTPTLGNPPPASRPLLSQAQALRASQDPAEIAADKKLIMKLTTRQDLVKGDLILMEGDLVQRIYTVASGQLYMKSNGKVILTIEEGEVFGVVTLFCLRPYNITIEVASEFASVLIIPAYRINDLISTNFPLAVRVHKKAAQVVYGQIERILKSREGTVVQGYQQASVFLYTWGNFNIKLFSIVEFKRVAVKSIKVEILSAISDTS